jgi:Na+-transporting methylmalonyl-CoA/oxaloacetate decarboxylase gamma subunit
MKPLTHWQRARHWARYVRFPRELTDETAAEVAKHDHAQHGGDLEKVTRAFVHEARNQRTSMGVA